MRICDRCRAEVGEQAEATKLNVEEQETGKQYNITVDLCVACAKEHRDLLRSVEAEWWARR